MKCTVCSLVPYAVKDTKPGIVPYEYMIGPSNGVIPSLLIIDDATSPLYRGSDMPPFPMRISAEEIARSFVNDYCKAQFEYTPDCHPALFWVPGEFTIGNDIVTKFPELVADAKRKQNNWYNRLIKTADDDWARNHQHKSISDIQRHAARAMGQLNKEWYSAPDPVPMVKCPACMTLVEGAAVVCRNCKHVLKPEEAKNLAFTG